MHALLNFHPVQHICFQNSLVFLGYHHINMASEFNLSPSDAHPESMDFLSLAWCNFAVQALKPEPQHGSLVLLDNPMKQFEPSSPIAHPTVSPSLNYTLNF